MFPFNQIEKTKDCGYRCLYYVLRKTNSVDMSYDGWLNQFRFFSPIKSGITFTDIHTILDYYKIDYCFTQLSENGLYIIYSGCWLKSEGKKHGHYFIYENGNILCSTHPEAYKMTLTDIINRLESKSIDQSFRCMKILGKMVEK